MLARDRERKKQDGDCYFSFDRERCFSVLPFSLLTPLNPRLVLTAVGKEKKNSNDSQSVAVVVEFVVW